MLKGGQTILHEMSGKDLSNGFAWCLLMLARFPLDLVSIDGGDGGDGLNRMSVGWALWQSGRALTRSSSGFLGHSPATPPLFGGGVVEWSVVPRPLGTTPLPEPRPSPHNTWKPPNNVVG